jgi:Zn-dependent peptidase ImmA (M78 family)
MCSLKIPRHSYAELESISKTFLVRAGSAISLYDGRALRIEYVIESSVCGYSIFPVHGLAEVADAYVPIKGKRIYIDEDQYLSSSFRVRFTLAEELSHIILHVPLFVGKSAEEVGEIQSQITDEDYQRMEREAKYMAGCLLMPAWTFTERFNHFYAIKLQQTANERNILLYVFRQVSMDFNVSCHSCAVRALKLDLIDQGQMDEISEFF